MLIFNKNINIYTGKQIQKNRQQKEAKQKKNTHY